MDGELTPAVPQQPDAGDREASLSQDMVEGVRNLAGEILDRKISDLKNKENKNGASGLEMEHGENALLTLGLLRDESLRDEWFQEGGSIKAVIKGKSVTINKDNFKNYSPQEILDAQLVEEATAILEQFTEGTPERVLLDLHIKALQGDDTDFSNAQKVEEAVKNARGSLDKAKAKDAESETSESPAKEQAPEDALISNQISILEGKIKALQEKGQKVSPQDRRLLVLLRVASQTGGAILKYRALSELRASGVDFKDVPDGRMEELYNQSLDELADLKKALQKASFSDKEVDAAVAMARNGDLEGFIATGILTSTEGLSEHLFGKQMKTEDLEELLNVQLGKEGARAYLEKYGKKAGLFFLLFVFFGASSGYSSLTKG